MLSFESIWLFVVKQTVLLGYPNNQIKAGVLRCVSEKDLYSSSLCITLQKK